MIVALFRSRLRSGQNEEYRAVATRMLELARAMPGFVNFKSFSAEDGERVSLVEFESIATLEAWRDHPEHLEAQRAGRERFYSEYRLQVCELVRDYGFDGETRSVSARGESTGA
jgi:heme-degrading monooxygenase HmoA